MTVKESKCRHRYRLFATLFVVALLQSCTHVVLVSNYDDLTDRYLTTLQQSTATFIDTLEQFSGTDAAAFEKHRQTYDALDQQLRQLEFRVRAIPKNDMTIAIVKNIRLAILGSGGAPQEGSSLKDVHCLNDHNKSVGPSKTALEICRRNVDQTISAALGLELAKKQGTN